MACDSKNVLYLIREYYKKRRVDCHDCQSTAGDCNTAIEQKWVVGNCIVLHGPLYRPDRRGLVGVLSL